MSDELRSYEDLMARMSAAFSAIARQKPLVGKASGLGGVNIGSVHSVDRGLDVVFYVVIHAQTQTVLGGGYTKSDAINAYRSYVERAGEIRVAQMCARVHADRQAEVAVRQASRKSAIEAGPNTHAPVKRIPRRRKAIFEKSGGICHYCAAPLTLDGKWHIEHKMPRALMGGNDPSNLVAACVPCNMKKRDRTDVEFIAAMGGA